jgi:hypothetical protein
MYGNKAGARRGPRHKLLHDESFVPLQKKTGRVFGDDAIKIVMLMHT